jgi:8-oxo-dGTP pyrophosphatase MutT (NUDIX family)
MPASDYVLKLREQIGHDLIMLVGAAGIIFNEQGEVLLQRRGDTGGWGTPGGAVDPGEEPAEAVIREVFEETGLRVYPERIVSVYGGADHMGTYPNGDEVAFTTIAFLCRIVGGALQIDGDETLELRYFPLEQLPEMPERFVMRIRAAASSSTEAHFHRPEA